MSEALEVGGEYAYRIRGEAHMWRPGVVADLQHAVRGELPEKYRSYAKQINEQSEQLLTLARHVPHQDRRGDWPQAGAAR